MAIKIKNKGEKRPEDSDDQEEPGVPAGNAPGSGLDGFERVSFMAAAWVENNRKLFFAMLGITAVAILGIVAGIFYVRAQQAEASDMLSDGIAAYDRLVEGDPRLEMFRAEDDIPEPPGVFGTSEEQWQAVYESADRTLVDFDGGAIADSARMTKAAAALNLEEYEESEQLYREIVDSDGVKEEFRATAHIGLANSLASQNKLDEAEAVWEQFVELQPERQAYADFEVARMIERYGDPEEAAERYEEFLAEHEESQYASDVERRKAML